MELALHGGTPVKTTPFGTGMRFGEAELKQLGEALNQNTLFYWKGEKVKAFLQKFCALYGMPHAVATSSGTAAIHTAIGALGVQPGDEVITSPITDMGSLIGILYQNAIPVFADLDPHTYNMTAQTIAEKITPKTKAILVIHLAGNAAEMPAIMRLAKQHGIAVIEDCAQSYMAYCGGQLAGTFGDIGCFSLNDFKHISAGDGGMLVMRDEKLYNRAFRFADKNYDRLSADPEAMRRVEYLAPNYRMTELQGAVGIAQLDKLEALCQTRRAYGDGLTRAISGVPGIFPHKVEAGNACSYWFYMLRIDPAVCGVSRDAFSRALAAEGIPNQAGYIPACVYEYDLFRKPCAYPGSTIPFEINHAPGEVRYTTGMCPTAEAILKTAIRLNISEFYTPEDMRQAAEAILKVAAYYRAKM